MGILEGKVAVITGAGGPGCGRAIGCRFAREGASVVLSDIDDERGLKTLRLIEAEGGRAIYQHCDVRREDQVRDMISRAETQFGGLDYLINNASALVHGDPLEYWQEAVETDLLGAMFCIRRAVDSFRRRGGGSIVNMTSTSALPHGRGRPAPAYDAAKAGLLHFTTMLSTVAETEKIRVNCLAPGWIASPEVREYWEALTPDERKLRGAPSRLLPLDDVAAAVLRLAIDGSLAGRVMVWWSEDAPMLIPWGDRGYAELDPVPAGFSGL